MNVLSDGLCGNFHFPLFFTRSDGLFMIQTPALKQITLIGVGLIGGSFVLDLKRQGLVEKVVGIDLDADNLARALERKVIDEAFEEINAQSVGGADWVLIATPVATLPHICRQLAPLLSAHTIVSDVGSTKQSALAAFAEHLGAHLPRCVAAHPIAGSDRHGALAGATSIGVVCPAGRWLFILNPLQKSR